jgi:hypothetical protein
MRNKYILIGVGIVVGVLLASVMVVLAGNLDSLSAPASTSSHTLEDIYNRLHDGTAGSPSTFTEPPTGPIAGSGHTLDAVMAEAPAPDNTDGATKAEVASGKTFWGLNVTAGEWGLQTGERYGGCTCTGIITPTGGTRWCDNLDGTVTDLTTCLVWLKKADWGGKYPFWADTAEKRNAHDRAALLGAGVAGADLSDGSDLGEWRLPTPYEFYGLISGAECVTRDTPRAFTGVKRYYWSSATSSISGWDDLAICADLGENPHAFIATSKTILHWVWPVRCGPVYGD